MDSINEMNQMDNKSLYSSTDESYFNNSHAPSTRTNSEYLYNNINPILFQIADGSALEFNYDDLDLSVINRNLPSIVTETAQIKCFRVLLAHAGFNSDDEARQADRWITIDEIARITGLGWGTCSMSTRNYRKRPAGRFSILRRKMIVEPFHHEYSIIVDTLGRNALPEDDYQDELTEKLSNLRKKKFKN